MEISELKNKKIDIGCEEYSSRIDEQSLLSGNKKVFKVTKRIYKNIEIGKNALVGAGSVVTKDVKPNTIVAGNPAKEIKNK